MKTMPNDLVHSDYSGLTIREYFAAMAMQALAKSGFNYTPKLLAQESVEMADYLIEELNKETKND